MLIFFKSSFFCFKIFLSLFNCSWWSFSTISIIVFDSV